MINISPKLLLLSFTLLSISASPLYLVNSSTEAAKQADLLVHNVYFYLNEDVTNEEIEEFRAGLEMLLNIPEISQAELGVPAKTEERDVTDHDFVYSIFTEFKTMEDYKVYAEHPDHMKFIDKYSHLWSDVKVYDSEIIFER